MMKGTRMKGTRIRAGGLEVVVEQNRSHVRIGTPS
jgi:hypothetical protein